MTLEQTRIYNKLLIEREIQRREFKRNKHKNTALNNFGFFLWYIVGYDFLKEPEHKKWIKWLQNGKKRKAIEAARGSGKSTMITVGYTLWRLVRDRNLTVLIICATVDLAKKFLYDIKRIIEANERFKSLFGDLKPEINFNKKWNMYEIEIVGKTKYREPNIEIGGIKTAKTGRHVELIICDDINNVDDYHSTASREEKKIRFNELFNILNPDGEIISVFTPWHDDDSNQTEIIQKNIIIENDNSLTDIEKTSMKWDVMISPAVANNRLVFPKLLNERKLKQARLEMDWVMYNMQYLLDIISEATLFNLKKFQYYNLEDLDFNYLNLVIYIDVATETKKQNDYTSITILARQKEGNETYIIENKTVKLSPSNLPKLIIDTYLEYKDYGLIAVGLEINKEKSMHELINKTAKENGINYIPIVEVWNKINKDSRIRRLEPLITNGIIKFPTNWISLCPTLVDQLIKYDGKYSDDAPDSLDGANQLLDRYSNVIDEEIETYGDRDYLEFE